MGYKLNQKHPERKEMLRMRRIKQLDRAGLRPYLHHGKYNGKDLRKIRQKNGVGGPPSKVNWAQAGQVNAMWERIDNVRKEREANAAR